MRILLVTTLIFLFCVLCLAAPIDKWNQANEAYDKGDYERATQLYSGLIEDGVNSAELHYNLGNAYFKSGKIGMAIGHYRKAIRLNPSLTQSEENLRYARQHTVDKVELQSRGFIVDLWNAVIDFRSPDFYLVVSTILFWIIVIMLSIVILADSLRTRLKYLLIIAGAVFIVISTMAGIAIRRDMANNPGVVITQSVEMLEGPGQEFGKLYICHDGLEFNIRDVRNGYYLVELANGLRGWILETAVMEI